MAEYRQLNLGEPAPWFTQRNTSNPKYAFDTVAGRYIVLCFFGTAGDAIGRNALEVASSHRALFDDDRFAFFGISNDPEDERTRRVKESIPGVRHFWDFDGTVGRLFGALPIASGLGLSEIKRMWVVLDPALNVIAIITFKADGQDRQVLTQFLMKLAPVSHYGGIEMHAPVIIQPHVFEPALCDQLVGAYESHGGELSGFMRDDGGQTVGVYDYGHKSRTDYTIDDEETRSVIQRRVNQKVAPVILKVHSFKVSRMERYIVGCYSSDDGGHFRPHRDNTTMGTAHRRFALSVNLNDDFDGGELVFPEYGP